MTKDDTAKENKDLQKQIHRIFVYYWGTEILTPNSIQSVERKLLSLIEQKQVEARKGLCNNKCANCFTLNKMDEAGLSQLKELDKEQS